MEKLKAVVRAIDVGYGNTKYTRDNAGESAMFPSVAPLASAKRLSDAGGGKRNTVRIEVGDNTYEVGLDALYAQSGVAFGKSMDTNFSTSDIYIALTLAACHYMGMEEIDLLVLGLPVSTWDNYRHQLADRVRGTHTITSTGRKISVGECKVLPQPLGGFYHHTVSNNLTDWLMSDTTNLVIDPGYFTLDWLVTHGTMINDDRSGAINNGGVAGALNAMSATIEQKIGNDIGGIHRLDAALLNGKPLRAHGEEIDLDKYRGVAEHATKDAIGKMVANIGTLADIDNVLIVGGGADIFADAIKEKFPKQNVIVGEEAVYANVRGFQIMGEKWANQK